MTPHHQCVTFVLVEPTHPGNVGAAARAIRTMGFAQLVVVRADGVDYRSSAEAVARATGGADVLASSRLCRTLDEALAGVVSAYAMSGYDRQYGPPLLNLRVAAQQIGDQARAGHNVALVFGAERSGLLNEDVNRCQACVAIPADPGFSSLNLAQAVQVAAYECQLSLRDSADVQPGQQRFDEEAAAPVAAVEAFYQHLQRALTAVGYFDPQEPKTLMPRLRRLFNRARPTATELDILRGICAAIIESREQRKGRKTGA